MTYWPKPVGAGSMYGSASVKGCRIAERRAWKGAMSPLVAAVRAGNPGLMEVRRDGRALVVAFVRLDVLGWFYVVEIDAKSLE
mgnify:CR=1 FL=1